MTSKNLQDWREMLAGWEQAALQELRRGMK